MTGNRNRARCMMFARLGIFIVAGTVAYAQASVAEEVKPIRLDDQRLAFQDVWQTCQKRSDCREVRCGCDGVSAAHHKYFEVAEAQAHKAMGDPRAMNCAVPPPGAAEGPIEIDCQNGKCGAFQFPRCRDPDCRSPYPQCIFTSTWYPDPKDASTHGRSERALFALKADSCRSKCQERADAVESRVRNPNSGQYRLECLFQGRRLASRTVRGSM